jgi:hypothetical protein
MRDRYSTEIPAKKSDKIALPRPRHWKVSKAANPKIQKVAIAGTACGKFKAGPNKVEIVTAKIAIAIAFKEDCLIVTAANSQVKDESVIIKPCLF